MTMPRTHTIKFFKPFFVSDDREDGKSSLEYFVNEMEYATKEGYEDVLILINSPGGEVSALLTMLDVMGDFPGFVTTRATGMAASCGFILLMSGDRREAYSSTALMSHQFSAGQAGKYHELNARLDWWKQLDQFMVQHYRTHTGLTEKVIRETLLGPTDTWLTAKDALALNVIDEVLTPSGGKPIGLVERRKAEREARKVEIKRALDFAKELEKELTK